MKTHAVLFVLLVLGLSACQEDPVVQTRFTGPEVDRAIP